MLFIIIYLLPNFWFYWFDLEYISHCSFWYMFSFLYALAVGFLLLSKDAFLMLSQFSLIVYYFPWNLTFRSWFDWNAFNCCFYMGGNKVFIFIIWNMSFTYLLKSIKLVSYSYHIMISNITIDVWGSIILDYHDNIIYIYYFDIYIYIYITYIYYIYIHMYL